MCSNVSFYLLQCCYFICQGGIVFSKCCIYIECLQSYRSKFIFYFSDFLRDLFYIPAKFRTALVVLSWLFYVLLGVVFVCIHEILLYHKLKFITSKVYIFMYYFFLLWIKHLELLCFVWECLGPIRLWINSFIAVKACVSTDSRNFREPAWQYLKSALMSHLTVNKTNVLQCGLNDNKV